MLRKTSVYIIFTCLEGPRSSKWLNHFKLVENAAAGSLWSTQVRHGSFYKDPKKEEKVCPMPPKEAILENDRYRINRPNLVLQPTPVCSVKPALNCKTGDLPEPCAERAPTPKELPPPRPPKPPFPWLYLIPVVFLFGGCGIAYKMNENKVQNDLIVNSSQNWKPRKLKRIPQKLNDIPTEAQYLIVGAGTAGMAAYTAIKEHDKTAKILFISEEDIKPYVRTGLSKELWTNPLPPDVEKLSFMNGTQDTSMFYIDADEYIDPIEFSKLEEGPAVSVASGWTIIRIDADEHTAYVTTKAGDYPIKYDKCLIAAGSEPKDLHIFKIAPIGVTERVCRLRCIRDLEMAWPKVRKASKIVIIGDGPLACELAYTMNHLSEYVKREPEEKPIEVTQVAKRPGVLSKVIPDYLGQWAAEKIKTEGVNLMTNLEVYDSYLTDEDEMKVFLSNGEEITADYVFLAVGVTPRTDLAELSLLEIDKKLGGYLVNAELMARTDLYVAGDCASLYSLKGDRVRIEHYNSAVDMGCVAGENMTGQMKPYTKPSTFTVKFGEDVIMQAFGETKSSMATVGVFTTCTVEQRGKDPKATRPEEAQGEIPCYKKTEEYKKRFEKGVIFYMRDDENVAGIVLWNMAGKEELALEILANNPAYDDIKSFVEKLELHEEDCCNQSAET